MDRYEFLSVIFVLLIASNCSGAYSIWNLRKLIGVEPKHISSSTNVSPLSSPGSSHGKESEGNPVDGEYRGKKPMVPELLNDSGKVNPKGSKNDDSGKVNPKDSDSGDSGKVNPKGSESDDSGSASTQKEIINGKNREETNGKKPDSISVSNGTCEGSTNRCSIQATLTACIGSVETGSKDLVLVIQNEGENDVKVKITIATALRNIINDHEIPKHQTKGINVSQTIGQSTATKIVLNAENGECVLQMGPLLSKGVFLQRLPSYYKQLTPIYGAYLLFLIALVVGGTWTCCKFRKRKRHDSVPYQELEMGLPESASIVNLEVANGWDEGWDDDWDEDKAVKSPGGRQVGSISASGLTAISVNRDGWEIDWDD